MYLALMQAMAMSRPFCVGTSVCTICAGVMDRVCESAAWGTSWQQKVHRARPHSEALISAGTSRMETYFTWDSRVAERAIFTPGYCATVFITQAEVSRSIDSRPLSHSAAFPMSASPAALSPRSMRRVRQKTHQQKRSLAHDALIALHEVHRPQVFAVS